MPFCSTIRCSWATLNCPVMMLQAMLLEQGYGQQLIGHLQPAPLLQRAAAMLPLVRSTGSDQLSPRSARAQQQQQPPQRSVRSVYTQTPLDHMGSFEDEPGMSQAHEVCSGARGPLQ